MILVVTDQGDTTNAKPANPLLGDALVLLAAVLYAANNVAQEKLLGKTCVLPSYIQRTLTSMPGFHTHNLCVGRIG